MGGGGRGCRAHAAGHLTFIRAIPSFWLYMTYSKILRRLREEKTNYKKRATMLVGRHDFITVMISNENTQVQILKPKISGDRVVASAHSRHLLERGWKGSRKSIPAAYLTGYLAGKKPSATAPGTRSFTRGPGGTPNGWRRP